MDNSNNMDQRQQFTFYGSFLDAIEDLSKRDQSAVLFAVCRYGLRRTEPEGLQGAASAAFKLIRPVLDSGWRKAQSGKMGGQHKTGNQNATVGAVGPNAERYAKALLAAYPSHRLSPLQDVQSAVAEVIHSDDDFQIALNNLEHWKQSALWRDNNGDFVKNTVNWLRSGQWERVPDSDKRETTPDEIAAIQRMMRED